MSLQPQTGNLTFLKDRTVHTFNVAGPAGPGSLKNLCPRYGISVVNASANHAVVKKSCFQYEYKPGRFYKNVEYFLYDNPTASMRSIWTASTEDTALSGPLVSPDPILKTNVEGYVLDWTVTDKTTSSSEKHQVKMRFIRGEKTNGMRMALICTDLKGKSGENIEQGACDGNRLDLITK
jgi:hypothetical protein